MVILQVFCHVKPGAVEAFRTLAQGNAQASLCEPGVVRFDILQQQDDPTRFALFEVYRSREGQAQHRETAHFAKWRDSVDDLLAEPRTRIEFLNVFPDDSGWS